MPPFSELELEVLRSLGVSPTDPAANALISRLADVKDLQLRGDPAFQAGSRFFGSRTGGRVESALSRFGQPGDTGETVNDLLPFGFDGDGGGGLRGGGGGGAFGGTRAGADLAQQQLLEQLGLEQGFEAGESALDRALREALATAEQTFTAGESRLGREFETAEAEKQRGFKREQELARIKAERLRIFSEMRGTDPVRAVLFAMGIGGESDVGGRFENLPPLKNAQAFGKQTETGLEALLGGKIRIGQGGVTGLQSPVKAAAAFSAGQGVRGGVGALKDARTLLTSAFGVGAEKGKGRPGMSRDEILRQIKSVTPQGVI